MKTTIKLGASKSLTVEPCAKLGGVIATLNFSMFGHRNSTAMHLTPDQCGVLMFGLEQALPVQDQLHMAKANFSARAG